MASETQKRGKIVVLKLQSRLDTTSAPEFEQECTSLINQGQSMLILDLKKVDYLSSSGLRVLLRLAKETEKLGGKLILCNLQQLPREVFEMSGFTSLFEITENLEDAMAIMQGL